MDAYSWTNEISFPVRYIKQQNGGKHRAINRGVKEANGELFFIVDCDDYLREDAVETILEQYNNIRNDNSFAGVCGLKCYADGTKIGGGEDFGILDCSSLEFRYKKYLLGNE